MAPFELEVLGRVADNYEAVHTIRGDLERDLGRSVSDEELSSTLAQLVALGLVDAFVFDATIGDYKKVILVSAPTDALWFYISQHGRIEYEQA